MAAKYGWKRFWCPRGDTLYVTPDGFLRDPELGFGASSLLALEDLAAKSCSVLLGEAGIGKTTEVSTFLERTRQRGGLVELVDLGDFGTEAQIEEEIVRRTGATDGGSPGTKLTLILDGLDEALVELPKVGGAIMRVMATLGRDRVSYWITCRTAAWPESLTKRLEQLFGQQELGIFELAPLRRRDIEMAAAAERLAPEEFVESVLTAGAGPLASIPVTLRLLIGLVREHRQLPNSLIELYEKGLLALCEQDRPRADRTPPQTLTASQRLQIASRFAAATTLAGRAAVFDGPFHDAPVTDVPLAELVGGQEDEGRGPFGVDASAGKAVLTDTGLFSARGASRFGFVHHSYGEFLAARYLHRANLSRKRLEALLFVPGEEPPRVAPQLHETAAWLSGFNKDLAQRLIVGEPEILLLGDVAVLNDTDKRKLVAALLDKVEAGGISYHDFSLSYHPYLPRLRHSDLPWQLAVVITDRELRDVTRDAAMTIAAACAVKELAECIARVTLSTDEPDEVRQAAAYSVMKLEDARASLMLKPLAFGEVGPDPYDALRGCALRALWPDHLTTSELLRALTPPQRDDYGGDYQAFFFERAVASEIPLADLANALRWAAQLPSYDHLSDQRADVAGQLLTRALDHLADEVVVDGAIDLFLARLPHGVQPMFVPLAGRYASRRMHDTEDTVQLSNEQRRRLLEGLVRRLASSNRSVLLDANRILRGDDLRWFMERATGTVEDESHAWAALAGSVFSFKECAHLELWQEFRDACPAIREAFDWLEPVELASDRAARLQKHYLRDQQLIAMGNERVQRPRSNRHERVNSALTRCFNENPKHFVNVLGAIFTADDGHVRYNDVPLLTDSPAWSELEPDQQREIIRASKLFLGDASVVLTQRTPDDPFSLADWAPEWALSLLLSQDRDHLEKLDEASWERFTPFVVFGPQVKHEARGELLQLAASRAPTVLREAVCEVVNTSRQDWRVAGILEAIRRTQDGELHSRVLESLKSEFCTPTRFRTILGWLLLSHYEPAREYAASLLSPPRFVSELEPRFAMEAATSLIVFSTDAGWPTIWPVCEGSDAFAEHLFETIAEDYLAQCAAIVQKLQDEQVAQFLNWLFVHYAPEDDPIDGARTVRRWRDGVVRYLQDRGTVDACVALERLHNRFPQYSGLAGVVLTAQRARRASAWIPPAPRDVLSLVQDSRRRIVRNASELLSVLTEALDDLEAELHGTTPARGDLWNLVSPNVCPKDENTLSDYVKRYFERALRDRLVGAYREVEIRRRTSPLGVPGERTDILVTAVAQSSIVAGPERIEVIVESKGCWNGEVRTAMQTQLVDRYLRDNRTRHGLYVVGWFCCAAWNQGDRRAGNCPWSTIGEARSELEGQARRLAAEAGSELDIRAYVLDCALR